MFQGLELDNTVVPSAQTMITMLALNPLDCLRWLHYGYPIALFFWFAISSAAVSCTFGHDPAPDKRWRRVLFICAQFVLIAEYVSIREIERQTLRSDLEYLGRGDFVARCAHHQRARLVAHPG